MARRPLRRLNKGTRLKTFEFEGFDETNKEETQGRVRAVNDKEARRQLVYKNIRIKKIKPVRKFEKRIKGTDITIFTRQLSSMMKAGVPLMQSLNVIARGFSNQSMAAMVLDIKKEIEQGNSLTHALEKYPKYFDGLYIGLVKAGETGGLLDTALNRVATQREKSDKLIRSVRKALIYPIFVVSVGVAVMVFMLVWVLPLFKKVYEDMSAELPAITRWFISFSDFLIKWGPAIVLSMIVIIMVFVYYYRSRIPFRKKVTTFLMQLPIFGFIMQRSESSRWARTFASLYAAGVPMTDILKLIVNSTKNILFKQATQEIHLQVEQGESLISSIISHEKLFPPLFVQLAEVGEEAGTLEEMMNKVSDYFDEEVDLRVSTLESMMESIIISVLAIFVGTLALAIYLPIFNFGTLV